MVSVPSTEDDDSNPKFLTPKNDIFHSSGQYQALCPEKREIRLLRLLPGLPSAQVRSELVHNVYLIKPEREYHALSYCAGDPSIVDVILVNGIPFNVFLNLGVALRTIRKPHQAILTWVDQICINQKNIAEREQQVSIMGSIYAGSKRTFMWLGGDEEWQSEATAIAFLDLLFDRLQRVGGQNHKSTKGPVGELDIACTEIDTPTLSEPGVARSNRALRKCATLLVEELERGLYKHELRALQKMCGSPYWHRCWVIQEVVLSSAADLMYGSLSIPFSHLKAAIKTLSVALGHVMSLILLQAKGVIHDINSNLIAFLESESQTLSHIRDLLLVETLYRRDNQLKVREAFGLSRRSNVTDTKDRIYAMLSLTDPDLKITPNYSPSYSIADTFTAATKAVIKHEGHLDILADGHETDRNLSLGLPSWVPDFSVPFRRLKPGMWKHQTEKQVFYTFLRLYLDAGPSLSSVTDPDFLPDEQGHCDRILKCAMFNLGSVAFEHTMADVPNPNDPDSVPQSFKQVINILASMKNVCLDEGFEYVRAKPSPFVQWQGRRLFKSVEATLSCGVTLDEIHCSGSGVESSTSAQRELDFVDRCREVTVSGAWRFFITPSNVMGIAPAAARWDDILCLFPKVRTPFVLRKLPADGSGDNNYSLIGEAYLHGYMHGEAILQILTGERKNDWEVIRIH